MSLPKSRREGVTIKELELNVQTLRELSDKSSSVAGRIDCTQDTICNCDIMWSYWTYWIACCDC